VPVPWTPDKAKADIGRLIQKYERIRADGQADHYKEEETKKDLILPLFSALGWDVNNDEAYEVTAEENVSRGRVDYGFRIDKVTKFYVEAKSLETNLDDADHLLQAIDYSYTKGVTWAVLTNFSRTIVLNADVKETNPVKSAVFDLRAEEYATSFDQLGLLSRVSVGSGELDRQVEKWHRSLRKKRIDIQLLDDLNESRSDLLADINRLNRSRFENAGDALEETVQRLLDRLIFIRVAEDRNLEDRVLRLLLSERDSSTVLKRLREIFRHFDDNFDSKLFALHLADEVRIDDIVLQKVIRGLYETRDGTVRYNFSVIDADILGVMYEQYLGLLLRKTAKQARLADGTANRREQGIYYTPTWVVDYMVSSAIGAALQRKGLRPESLRLLDPACGSGSFLLRAFAQLKSLRNPEGAPVQSTFDPELEGRLVALRTSVLKENLFGVDLDPRAAEIAQLNLMIQAAETRHRLPTLERNIRIGNSVVEDHTLDPRAFDWNGAFPQVMKSGGFDVVVCNPPYVNAIQLSKLVSEEVKAYWSRRWKGRENGAVDLFVHFFNEALDICREGGSVAFITPNKYLSAPYGEEFRKSVAEKHTLLKLVDLSRVRVFDDPSVYPVITVIRKGKDRRAKTVTVERPSSPNLQDVSSHDVNLEVLRDLPENLWGPLLSDNAELIHKIFSRCRLLGEIATVQATSTAAESDLYSSFINESQGLKLINTGAIDRYATTWGLRPLRNKGMKFEQPRLAVIGTSVSADRSALYNRPKILFAKLALRIEAFLDGSGEFASINTNCVHSPEPEYPLDYLLTVLNSSLITFVYSELFSGLVMSKGYFQFQAPQLRLIPIAPSTEGQRAATSRKTAELVGVAAKLARASSLRLDEARLLTEKMAELDREADKLVYSIYGLDARDVEAVEGSVRRFATHDPVDVSSGSDE
jgi:type I restriction-modification system DNA methylase subunit